MFHLQIPTLHLVALGVAILVSGFGARPASAEATLIVEADSGKVLHAEHATYPWYPASTTKLMTMYLTLKAVKDKRLELDSPLTVSPNAVAQAPSKMGFKTGTVVTVDNALKMLMVKSANDMAVVLAEGVAGSIEKFSEEMMAASKRLGMTQSSWVNPNGLPADEQITSARDMAMLARAILKELPEYDMYWHIPAIRFGRRVMRNTNGLIGRYPEADGMKTGFICASGFNVVATATRGGRKLIVVVFGSRSGAVRSEKAAQLFEKGFNSGGLSWLMPSLGTVDALQAVAAAPPNLREDMCGKGRRRPASEEADDEEIAGNATDTDQSSAYAVTMQSMRGRVARGPILQDYAITTPPIPVFVGTGKKDGKPDLASQLAAIPATPKNARSKRKPQQPATAVATAPAPKPDKPDAASPATANASTGSFNLTPLLNKLNSSNFAPASAESKPVAAPGAKPDADKKKVAAKPAEKKSAAKPKAKTADTKTAQPDSKSKKQ